jgi:hypothetical protein
MCLGIAKVDKQSIAEELGEVSLVPLDDFSTHLLIRTDHFAIVFRVELTRELSGVHHVTEHDGQLSSFSVGRRCSGERFDLRGVLFLDSRLLSWLSKMRGDFPCISDPDKDSVILIAGKPFRLNQVDFQVFDILVIQLKAALQGAVRDALLPLQ